MTMEPFDSLEEEKIIALFPERDLEIVRRDQAKKCSCHSIRQVLVCDATRTIECSYCKGLVDPFAYILRWANEATRKLEGLRKINVQTRIAQAELTDLERKIKNARATLQRRGVPQPVMERRHFDDARRTASYDLSKAEAMMKELENGDQSV